MVPGAIGTQTAGSVIRPASYCGVVGFKPSFGLVSRRGILSQSRFLDTVGTFGRSLEDAALLADCIIGHDSRDPDSRPVAHQRLLETARSRPPVKPDLAFVRTPMWDEGDADMHGGFAELVEMLGERVEEVELPEAFGQAIDLHRTVMLADFAKAFARDYEHHRDQLSERLRGMIADGGKVLAADYSRAMDWRDLFNVTLDRIFERYNAIITRRRPRCRAVGDRGHRKPGVLLALDLLWRAGRDTSPAPGRTGVADRRTGGGPARRRCPIAAHRPLAGRHGRGRGMKARS
jgi:Asp-tRNA(Asn)/Glu-tRNA(Gln) amidotransferase A subunit family amidase